MRYCSGVSTRCVFLFFFPLHFNSFHLSYRSVFFEKKSWIYEFCVLYCLLIKIRFSLCMQFFPSSSLAIRCVQKKNEINYDWMNERMKNVRVFVDFLLLLLKSSGRIQSDENETWKGKHPHRPQNHRSMTWKMKTKCLYGIHLYEISNTTRFIFRRSKRQSAKILALNPSHTNPYTALIVVQFVAMFAMIHCV